MTVSLNKNKHRQQRKSTGLSDVLKDLFGDKFGTKKTPPVLDGFSLDNDIKGEIIEVTLAPNESKIISHGLRAIPKYRLILRQTGNAVITDVNSAWTDRTIGLLNNSSNSVVLTLKLMQG